MRSRVEYAVAVLLDLLGGAGALLAASRTWQTVHTPRPRPLVEDVLDVSGRTIDAAPTALALVALAGVVAVLATRGLPRRLIGAALTACGALLCWRSIAATLAISAAQARALVQSRHSGVGVNATGVERVVVHLPWGLVSVVGGVAVVVAGVLVGLRGHRWGAMSVRYDAPAAGTQTGQSGSGTPRPEAALWSALDRGDDPTALDPRGT